MKREYQRTDGDLSEQLEDRDRLYLAGSALFVGFITAVFLAGCASAMGLIAATPEDPTAAYESELITSLGIGSAPVSTWNVATDGSALNLAPEYAGGERYANVVYATNASELSASSSGNQRVVHPDDYLGNSTDVGQAFTSAVIDDTMTHSAGSQSNAISFW